MNRRIRKSILLAFVLLSGCATAGPTPEQQDTIGDAVQRVGKGTMQQATGMGSRRAQGEIWQATDGSMPGQIGVVLLGNVGREIQRAMSGRP